LSSLQSGFFINLLWRGDREFDCGAVRAAQRRD